jgi:hypothetical protein
MMIDAQPNGTLIRFRIPVHPITFDFKLLIIDNIINYYGFTRN